MGGGPKKVKKRDDVILEWSLSKSKHLDDPFPDYVINGWTLWIYGIQKKKNTNVNKKTWSKKSVHYSQSYPHACTLVRPRSRNNAIYTMIQPSLTSSKWNVVEIFEISYIVCTYTINIWNPSMPKDGHFCCWICWEMVFCYQNCSEVSKNCSSDQDNFW